MKFYVKEANERAGYGLNLRIYSSHNGHVWTTDDKYIKVKKIFFKAGLAKWVGTFGCNRVKVIVKAYATDKTPKVIHEYWQIILYQKSSYPLLSQNAVTLFFKYLVRSFTLSLVMTV